MNAVKKNYVFQLVYQILILVIPLITAPYIARVLGPSAVGTQSYTYNIANYFVYFSMLGLAKYGNRCVSEVKDDKDKLNVVSSELIVIHVILSTISTIAYILFVIFFTTKLQLYYIISIIYLFGTFFDINWLFFGLEEFKLTVIRNLAVKITSTIFIFLLVKSVDDLWIYILILALSQFLSYIFLWPYLKKRVSLKHIKVFEAFKKHIISLLILFIPVVAVSLYTSMDKIMLGTISGEEELGFYEASEKIVILIMAIITSLGTVLLPRITNLNALGKVKEVEEMIDKSNLFNCFITFGCMFGIASISSVFIPFFYGDQYNKSILILQILSISIVFSSFSDISRSLFLIPKKKDNVYVIAVCVGAVINLCLNIILINNFGASGAAIATVCAEMFVCLIQLCFCYKGIRLNHSIVHIILFCTFGLIMFLINVFIIPNFNFSPFLLTVVKLSSGAFVYCGLSVIYYCIYKSIRKKRGQYEL